LRFINKGFKGSGFKVQGSKVPGSVLPPVEEAVILNEKEI
jgi:hypothetical protein